MLHATWVYTNTDQRKIEEDTGFKIELETSAPIEESKCPMASSDIQPLRS